MERIEYHRYGGPGEMRIASFSLPSPGSHEILVHVRAAFINPIDWGLRQGKMKLFTGSSFPRAVGKDFAGTIAQVGANVVGWRVGDEVVGCVPWRRAGSFASMALVRPQDIVKNPETMSFVQAATLPTVGLTAWHSLIEKAHLKSGQLLLVNGATGALAAQHCRSRDR